MPKYLIYLLTLTLLFSCGQNSRQQQVQPPVNPISDSLAVVNDPTSNLNIQTSDFYEIDTSGILMFPLSMGETETGRGSLSYKEIDHSNHWNIIFYNPKTKGYRLLSERKMLIESYDYKYESDENIDPPRSIDNIFYTIRVDDFNNDQLLNDNDPKYLFVSDKAGNNFRQISPKNCQLHSWKLLRHSSKVIMTVGKDSDKNGRFDESDEITTFELELDKPGPPKEVFTDKFKNKLKMLFDRDWKRLSR